MKNNKKGFSLAEVLIAVTIAAIIATMGFTIARKGIERAYNIYIYTGYYALTTALSDAEDGLGYTIRDCVLNNNLHNVNACNFSKRFVDVLSGRHVSNTLGSLDFDTPNGTNFHIEPIGNVTPKINDEDKPENRYRIIMRVPSVKTRNSSVKTVCMVYVENLQIDTNYTENFLLPYQIITDNSACNNSVPAINDDTNIQVRKDLLAFYFEDGKRGRVLKNETTNQDEYNARIFRSAQEAMCIKFSAGIPNIISSYLNCNGLILVPPKQSWESQNTVIKVTDPRRL